MPKVIEIAISESSGRIMKNVNNVESIAGKGLFNEELNTKWEKAFKKSFIKI